MIDDKRWDRNFWGQARQGHVSVSVIVGSGCYLILFVVYLSWVVRFALGDRFDFVYDDRIFNDGVVLGF